MLCTHTHTPLEVFTCVRVSLCFDEVVKHCAPARTRIKAEHKSAGLSEGLEGRLFKSKWSADVEDDRDTPSLKTLSPISGRRTAGGTSKPLLAARPQDVETVAINSKAKSGFLKVVLFSFGSPSLRVKHEVI